MRSNIGFVYCIAGVLVFASVVQAEDTRGTPGVDYPNYHSIPETSFSCSEQKYIPGFYADLETKCQAFHFCFENRQESFLCPTGLTFNQAILGCDAWYSSNCSLAPSFYNVNSGPVMESAGKNLPMLLKLRKLTVPTSTADLYEKITSLYETSSDSTPSHGIETSSVPNSSDSKPEAANDNSNEALPRDSETESEPQFVENISSGLEGNFEENGGAEAEVSEGDSEGNEGMVEVDEMDANLVYDPVTDGYYMTYDKYEADWQQDSEPVSNEFESSYDYRNVVDEYGLIEDTSSLTLGNSGDEYRILRQALPASLDMDVAAEAFDETTGFSKRQMQTDQSKRVRRKPIYVVQDEEPEVVLPSRRRRTRSYEAGSSTEILDTSTEGSEETNPTSGEPFPRPTAIPPHLREPYNTPRPLTTSEFEKAILDELVGDQLFGTVLTSDDMEQSSEAPSDQAGNEESREDASVNVQADDQSVYAQYVTAREDYESDASAYGFKDVIEDPEGSIEAELYEGSQVGPSYQTKAADVSMEDAYDAFIVIPDELESEDNVVDTASEETKDEVESADYFGDEYTYGDAGIDEQMRADAYRYYESRFEFPEVNEPSDSPRLKPIHGLRNFRKWRREYPFYKNINPKLLGLPYDVRGVPYIARGKAQLKVDDVDLDSYTPEMMTVMLQQIMNNRRHNYGYQQDQPMNYLPSLHVAQNPYVYEDPYTNPYVEENGGMLDYDAIDNSNVYFDPESDWVQQASNENGEMENVFGATDGPLPIDVTEGNFADLDESSRVDLSEETEFEENLPEDFVQEEESNNEDDVYYVFDFDGEEQMSEDAESKFGIDTEALEPNDKSSPSVDSEQDGQNLLSSDAPISTGNISLDADNIDKSSDSRSIQGNDMQLLNSMLTSENGRAKSMDSSQLGVARNTKSLTDTLPFHTTESSLVDEKPVTFSTLERLAVLKNTRSPQAANVENPAFTSDSKYVSNMAFSESMDFGPYGFGANLGQQYGILNSMQSSKTRDAFSQRTGETDQPKLSKLSSIQEKLRSMKQGKFGAFKKYIKNQKD